MSELKTLKDIIKATTDYEGYAEAQIMSAEDCKKYNINDGYQWNGSYSGELIRLLLREEAQKWIEQLREYIKCNSYAKHSKDAWKAQISWIKMFFNI